MPVADVRSVDVLDISDLRFRGGTSRSIAEEITAQTRGGYTTGLLHLNGPLVARVSPVNPVLRQQVEQGHARLLIGRELVRARLVVIRHPAVLQHAATALPPIDGDHVVIVANAAPQDIDGHEHYQPDRVHEIATRQFGREPIWAPIGPLVRAAIASQLPADALLPTDWVNVIDVDSWWVTREGWRGARPVVGRHSRPSPQKWPRDAATIRAVYPTDGSWTVRILGGAEPAEKVLGGPPARWEIQQFGEVSPEQFLAGLDFFVYYHDPRWVEAFGRSILEALASGLPAVLPPHFRGLFGEGAVYAEPDEVRGVVDGLYTDRAAYEAQVARGQRVARERFGHEAHLERVQGLIGEPSTSPEERFAPMRESSSTTTRRSEVPRVLFITSNGAGMGHLTRLLAYASRIEPAMQPHFLSLSAAVPVVGNFGYPYEYLPSAQAVGLLPKRWHDLFTERVSETITRVRPSVVVFDGTWPYDGIPRVRAAHPGPRWVWSRRGLWRSGKNRDQIKKAAWFDDVIEPGDFAAAYDTGVTVSAAAYRVPPVTLLDIEDLQDRTAARRDLGLDLAAPMALVSLGAGTINDTRDDVGAAVAALRSMGVGICVTRPEIAVGGTQHDDVHVLREFPLSRRYRAFDLAVSAAGYNSFHELLRFGVPTLFVPNRATALDDQQARALFAAEQGFAHRLDTITVDTAKPLLADLLERGAAMVAGLTAVDHGNGASAAAARIADHVASAPKA